MSFKKSRKTKQLELIEKQEITEITHGFSRQGLTINAFCIANGINQGYASEVLRGVWTGEKATVLKNRIIQASKAKPTQDTSHENS